MSDYVIGIDTTGRMWTTPDLSSDWTRSPANETLIAATGTADGAIVGVRPDHTEVISPDGGTTWASVLRQAGQILSMRTLPDGSFLGVAINHVLYTRANLESSWQGGATAGGAVKDAFVLTSGPIVGVGMQGQLASTPNLETPWTAVANWDTGLPPGVSFLSCCTLERSTEPNGDYVVGVGTDNNLYTKGWNTPTWQQQPWPATAPTGGVVFVAVGTSGTGHVR